MSQTVINSTTIDDTSPLITYAGASWTVHTNQSASTFHLYNNTDTFTDVQGATATLRFYGNAIEYWGNRGPYHGNCLVTIDGQDLATANSNAPTDDTPILLFSTNQLALKDHELVIKVLDAAYPAVCEIDRFVVNVTSNPTTTGLSTNTALYPTGSVASGNTGGGTGGSTGGSSSSPPIAAIAGGVGGAAVLCLLLVAFWLYKRSKKNRGAIVAGSKLENPSVSKPLLSEGPSSPSQEKNGFRAPQTYPNQPSSYMSSSPPASSYNHSSPPPSSTGFNPYLLSTPNSPQPGMRPMSTVSASSAAPTSHYSSGAPTTEGGFQGYYPQPPQPLLPQQQQQYQQPQQQYQQQPVGVAPVWAQPEPTSSPPPTHMQHPSVPSPSQSPAPVVVTHPSPSASPAPAPISFPPEKAQYMPRPEKSGFSGAQADTTGASGSSAPAPTAGASASGTTPHSPDIMSPLVPDLPPPAYQF